MKCNDTPAIERAERLSDGIVVKFADGVCVFFSATVLYRTIPQAQVQVENGKA